jgi:flagellar capping protein FliD
MERLDERIERTSKQLESKEEYYRNQFANMQQALYQLSEQQSLLSSLFG